jgi:hypothetical protein
MTKTLKTTVNKRAFFNTNNGEQIFGFANVNLSEYLCKHKNLHYFKTKENNVVWCEQETFDKLKNKKDFKELFEDAKAK